MVWNTKEPNVVQLTDVNRLAAVKIGDTIITDGKSTIFPEGILIGTIKKFTLGENDSFNLDIQLFNDMTSLNHVYVIENKEADKDIGVLENLRHFERWRKSEAAQMIASMEVLKRLFDGNNPVKKGLRDLALVFADKVMPLKSLFIKQAMGLSGELPKIMKTRR